MLLTDGAFSLTVSPRPTDWFHLVIVINGPNNGEGFSVYYNAHLKETDTTKGGGSRAASSGKLNIGRRLLGTSGFSSSVVVDELTLWNRKLTGSEISAIYQMY